jgi:hypothetical protein
MDSGPPDGNQVRAHAVHVDLGPETERTIRVGGHGPTHERLRPRAALTAPRLCHHQNVRYPRPRIVTAVVVDGSSKTTRSPIGVRSLCAMVMRVQVRGGPRKEVSLSTESPLNALDEARTLVGCGLEGGTLTVRQSLIRVTGEGLRPSRRPRHRPPPSP